MSQAPTASSPPTPSATQTPSPSASSGVGALLDPLFMNKIEQLELVSRKIFVGRMKGERKSKRRGSSVEFADHRNYTVGDDLRHIDWNIYGRLDKLFIKLFMEEEDLHFYTLLDNSLSMDFGEPSKLYYGKQVAAALAFIGLVNHDRVVLEHFNASLEVGLASLRGRSQMWRVIQYLEKLKPSGQSRLASSAKTFAIKHSGKGVVVFISDFLDKSGYEEALRYLLAKDLDIHVIHVLSKEELDPDLVGDLRLIDAEDADEAEVTVSAPLIKKYKNTVNAFVGSIKDWCSKRGISYIFTSTSNPFDKLVLNYLRRRGLLK